MTGLLALTNDEPFSGYQINAEKVPKSIFAATAGWEPIQNDHPRGCRVTRMTLAGEPPGATGDAAVRQKWDPFGQVFDFTITYYM